MGKYLTAPIPSKKMPKGIPYIIANEAAERFSYYGMNALLAIFMTTCLRSRDGSLDVMTEPEATLYTHLFIMGVYAFPLIGALISDMFLGKYRTVLYLSIVYCLGHLTLALDVTRPGLLIGCLLIVIGAGGIKPCVSANVGDQFGESNQHLLTKVFGWFYFSINVGATFSMLLTPLLLDRFGPRWAFGVPGIFMFIATVAFWMGRHKFVHIPPSRSEFVKECFGREGLGVIRRLAILFVFVSMFFSLFDQSHSAWVLQGARMNTHWLGMDILPAQMQAANPILVLILIPIFGFGIYPAIHKVFPLTPLRKISIGLFVTVICFAISALLEMWIAAGGLPNIGWQAFNYVILTCAEVMVSITCLEFAYTQAPRKMKSLIMSFYLL
ncbi:MAG: MFS transporter, partial [Sedimentisphaerales bacterium]|nr:MFS transporter [Sedimentisphaerales bacterium]